MRFLARRFCVVFTFIPFPPKDTTLPILWDEVLCVNLTTSGFDDFLLSTMPKGFLLIFILVTFLLWLKTRLTTPCCHVLSILILSTMSTLFFNILNIFLYFTWYRIRGAPRSPKSFTINYLTRLSYILTYQLIPLSILIS